ncbi:hypothetical protein FA15DRAFT_663884 [Coprinopsis marcescibilis]|uniref:RING-type domain-containing protein n=1 Tax=Coprinopsis marcescibilis TaxID=230819 RepID=A0A5C3LBD4_COPMA|nr:hypothetical protein FA15DRAFT_663884 [Coprinopsis marcescibilis]
MPADTSSDSAILTRRSSRLSAKEAVTQRLGLGARRRKNSERGIRAGEIRKSSRTTRTKPYFEPTISHSVPFEAEAESSNTRHQPQPALRRSLRIAPADLVRRENALFAAEQDHKRQAEELLAKVLNAEKQLQETAQLLSQIAERDQRETLSHLEEHFLCPLCYEVMSAPHSLNAGSCGHSFCGMCILKWFFSRLHVPCENWHESVDCPICRSLLTMTPEATPREESTFPFVPNRLASTVITSYIEKISTPPVNTAMTVKREENEGVLVSGSKRGRNCSRANKAKEEEEHQPRTPDLDAWRDGGHLKVEWTRKDREGKAEMGRLLQSWKDLTSTQFVGWKLRLGV